MSTRSSTTLHRACSSCHVALLRSFVAAAGAESCIRTRSSSLQTQLKHPRHFSTATAQRSYFSPQRRTTQQIRRWPYAGASTRSQTTTTSITASDIDNDEAKHIEELVDATEIQTANSGSSYVPWYLQQQSSVSVSSQPIASGQDMPDIPEHSPVLLEPIVKHTLESLGLTHFNILDLRQMTDPPPALGANLLMVLATARSERHLHASADKLCRWLRTEYKLSPVADGLLGRNEMKIAIRRRAKRAKMLSAVGARPANEGDIADGLRSDWICVNVGRVDGGMLPDLVDAETKRDIVGFGTFTDSSTIVVQMMTEDKRTELDLEGLWAQALRRQIKQKEAIIRSTRGEEPVNRESETSLELDALSSNTTEARITA